MKKTITVISLLLIAVISNAQTNESYTHGFKKKIYSDSIAFKRDTSYVLKGKLSDFQILYTYLKSPGDVTPNQLNAILKWV